MDLLLIMSFMSEPKSIDDLFLPLLLAREKFTVAGIEPGVAQIKEPSPFWLLIYPERLKFL